MIYETEKKRIGFYLDWLIWIKKIKKTDTLVLFGAGENSKFLCKMLRERNCTHIQFVDNDVKKQGKSCAGMIVQSPQILCKKENHSFKVLLYSAYEQEMSRQLRSYGYRKNKDYFLLHQRGNGSRSILCSSIQAMRGMYIYQSIRKPLPKDCRIFVCPYHGIGDAYLIGSMLREYLYKNSIKEYVILTVSRGCAGVLRMFGIRRLRIMGRSRIEALIKAWMFAPDLCEIILLNDSWNSVYTNPLQGLRGYKGLTFSDMFRYAVFQADTEKAYRPSRPCRRHPSSVSRSLAGRIDKSSIILAPYSNTLTEIPETFWEEVVRRLQRKGYRLFTNVSGAGEHTLKGTESLSFPLEDTVWVLEQAAGFIGMRSGLCDAASSSHTVKVILYDRDSYFYAGLAKDYFGLIRMGLCEDAYEYSYTGQDAQLACQICALWKDR